jgi:hypothetical protein
VSRRLLANFDVAVSQDDDFYTIITAGEFVSQDLATKKAGLAVNEARNFAIGTAARHANANFGFAAGARVFDAKFDHFARRRWAAIFRGGDAGGGEGSDKCQGQGGQHKS